jgi:hypothetical protein
VRAYLDHVGLLLRADGEADNTPTARTHPIGRLKPGALP